MIKKVPPRWQRLGFSSEEEMNKHSSIYKRRKAQIIAKKARWLTHRQAKKEKEN